MKAFIHTVVKMFAVILVAAVIGVALLTAVFAMPDTQMRAHLQESAINRVFVQNLAYEFILDGQLLTFTDNHADARFLMSACNWNTDSQNAMQRAMEAAFPNVDGVLFRPQSLNEIFGKGATNYTLYPYARYWHGVQVFIRPLLFFFNYAEMITLNGIVQALLLGIILMFMAKRGLWREAIGVIGGVWGAITGVSASKGKRRGLVLNSAKVLMVLGIASLIIAGAAFFTGQPYHVWFPFLVLGAWPTVFLPFIYHGVKKVYTQAELKKMSVDELEG